MNSFARLFATSTNATVRDGAEAMVLAEKAVAATRRTNDAILDTLAAAYAETGKFTNAVLVQKEAIGLPHDKGDTGNYGSRLKLYESNSPYREASTDPLTPAADNPVAIAALLQARGRLCAQYGQWKEAIPDLARAIELHPNDDLSWYLLSPLLVESGDVAGYRKHRQAMLARFGTTDDLPTALRMAKGSLLLPLAGADFATAVNLAEKASTAGKDFPVAPFQFTKGLAEYRQGHFTEAIDWVKKALAKEGVYYRDAQAYAVLAMAQRQLNQPDASRAALAKANEIAQTKLPKPGSDNLGASFYDCFIARILLREAKALIEGTPQPGPE